jgi:hypothetical protein
VGLCQFWNYFCFEDLAQIRTVESYAQIRTIESYAQIRTVESYAQILEIFRKWCRWRALPLHRRLERLWRTERWITSGSETSGCRNSVSSAVGKGRSWVRIPPDRLKGGTESIGMLGFMKIFTTNSIFMSLNYYIQSALTIVLGVLSLPSHFGPNGSRDHAIVYVHTYVFMAAVAQQKGNVKKCFFLNKRKPKDKMCPGIDLKFI